MRKNNKEIVKNLIKNIRQEFSSLEEIYTQIEPLVKKAEGAKEDERVFYNRAAGSILHDFYTGWEKVFCDIANKIDGGLPPGKDWHIKLLKSMSEPTSMRPRVIPLKLMEELKEYLGFRHLFRNIYGTQLDWDKLSQLLNKLKIRLWEELRSGLELFIENIKNKK